MPFQMTVLTRNVIEFCCKRCHATNINPPPNPPTPRAMFTGQGNAKQEPVGELQSSLWVPELRHYECTRIWHQGLTGDDGRGVGKVCQLTLRHPGGRLPNWGLEVKNKKMQTRKGGERMYFALNKATDFSNSLGIHIWILRVWQGHYVPIQYKDWRGRKKTKKREKKNISVTFLYSH